MAAVNSPLVGSRSFPSSPSLTFIKSGAPNGLPQYCLTRESASDLSAFFDKLEAFKRAYTDPGGGS